MIIKNEHSAVSPYLKDASNFPGSSADAVVIPETTEELVAFLKDNDQPVTLSGARTGLTASGIPLSGLVVSLEKFRQLEGPDAQGKLRCGPAVRLREIQEHLKGSGWFYPPNPTEALASVGGTVATNASGSRSYKWGATRNYIEELEIVLVDGRRATVRRGQSTRDPLVFDDGSRIVFPEIGYTSPDCKNAAGFFVRPGMDWLDLFVGSDGTLCLFTRIQLKLLPDPADFLSGILFFKTEEACWDLVEALRSSDEEHIRPCALEYFDRYSLSRLKTEFPTLPSFAQAALFFEQDVPDEDAFDAFLESWYEFLESREVDLDASWFSQSPADLEKFHEFRHRVPLIINEENSRNNRMKMGTDMAVPDSRFQDMMRYYRATLEEAGMPYVVFGHIGDNHLHINLMPPANQRERALAVYDRLVTWILQNGGTVSAEHGIGKIKKDYYRRMVGAETLDQLIQIKRCFDPRGLLGQGNLF
ncbi:MAG: FAD-binding oxidoreductase [Nitrospina sp.]|nr:FAD-binding oxidoreductase [Nitrospina sp.]